MRDELAHRRAYGRAAHVDVPDVPMPDVPMPDLERLLTPERATKFLEGLQQSRSLTVQIDRRMQRRLLSYGLRVQRADEQAGVAPEDVFDPQTELGLALLMAASDGLERDEEEHGVRSDPLTGFLHALPPVPQAPPAVDEDLADGTDRANKIINAALALAVALVLIATVIL